MDHLRGKVFVEYLSRLKQNRIKTKLQKEAREHKAPSDGHHTVF
jgi:peptide deformylase